MPAVRKISLQQQRILADFMASNLDFAHNRTVGESGAGGRESSARLWQGLTATLNAEGAGVTKTVDEWKKYWKRFKYEVKAKAAALRRSAARTGGGPCTLPPLTDVEEIVVGIIGEHAITGYSQVRIDNVAVDSPAIAGPSSQPPFLQSEETVSSNLAESSAAVTANTSYSAAPASIPEYDFSIHSVGVPPLSTESQQPQPGSSQPRPHASSSTRRTTATSGVRKRKRAAQSGIDDWLRDIETRRIDVEENVAHELQQLRMLLQQLVNLFTAYLQR